MAHSLQVTTPNKVEIKSEIQSLLYEYLHTQRKLLLKTYVYNIKIGFI